MTIDTNKRIYETPFLLKVPLDNEISLVLASGSGGLPPNPPFSVMEFEQTIELCSPIEPLIF